MSWSCRRKAPIVVFVVCVSFYVWLFHFQRAKPSRDNNPLQKKILSDYCSAPYSQTSQGNLTVLAPRRYTGKDVTSDGWNATVTSTNNLLTLFTSWPHNPSRYFIYNNTLLNWALLHPQNVSTVLFTNNKKLGQWARQVGWWVLPITHAAPFRDGPPILPTMFRQVMRLFKSELYAFANGDILFDDSLVQTINSILEDKCFLNHRHLMITGRRTNLRRISTQDALHWPLLKLKAKQAGRLFTEYSSDYFITNREYPWSGYPNIAIARRAYDNWLVLRANQLGHVVVDGSGSILAVHQEKTSDRAERKSRCKANYNVDLIESIFYRVNYGAGRTVCAEFESGFTELDTIFILKRGKRPSYCYEFVH